MQPFSHIRLEMKYWAYDSVRNVTISHVDTVGYVICPRVCGAAMLLRTLL